MKTITLRDIPDAIAKSIQRQAEITGASLNKTVIDMLSTAINSPRCREHHDLDHLIGRWTDDEAKEMAEALDAQRVIDAEMWK
jgi:hypothetical protein